MSHPNESTPLDVLLMLQVQGEISAEQCEQLQKSIRENVGVLDYCLDFLIVCAGLSPVCQEDNAAAASRLGATLKHHQVRSQNSLRHILRSSCKIAAMLMLGGLAAFGIIRALQQSQSQGLAQVINGLAAKWEDASLSSAPGTRLSKGPRHLLEGVAELQMASGTRLLVQGPCQFSLDSKNGIRLSDGAITASVPKKARSFVVETPDCTVVDYGTEFGIRAQANAQTEIHVFSGQVTVEPKQPAPGQAGTVNLKANEAALVKASTPIKIQAANPALFMHELPQAHSQVSGAKQLSLADIVGGGNGFGTGKVGQGIDTATGAVIQIPGSSSLDQLGAFIMLMDQRYIDGVFAPNSQFGEVSISTTGLVFPQCPQAAACYLGGVFNQVKSGTDASGVSDPSTLSHQCNTGITFDLDRLRRDNPGVSIQGLDTSCRMAMKTLTSDKTMDFWVLVDGKVQAHHQLSASDQRETPISLQVEANTRFLTLATTCPENTKGCWGEFVEPRLSLAPQP